MNRKKLVLVVVVALLLGILVGVGFFVFSGKGRERRSQSNPMGSETSSTPNPTPNPNPSPNPNPAPLPPGASVPVPPITGTPDLTLAWVDKNTDAPSGTLYKTFYSKSIKHDVSYLISLPPSYNTTSKKYPVLYWLHGGGGNSRTGAKFVELASAQMKAGKIPEFIIVLPQGFDSMWINSFDGTMPIETVVIGDLLPYIDQTYRTIGTREARGIEGFSMGGYGASHLGYKYYDRFGVVSDLSGAVLPLSFWQNDQPEIYQNVFSNNANYLETNHPFNIVKANADQIRGHGFYRIVVGDADNGRGTYGANLDFHNLLSSLSIAHEWDLVPGVKHCYECLYQKLGDNGFTFYKEAFAAYQ